MTKKKCTFDPRTYTESAIGQFHCPVCGEMVVAGFPHPDYSIFDKQIKEYPIMFHDEMVVSIMRGIKTMTRRIITPQPPGGEGAGMTVGWYHPTRIDKNGEEYPGEKIFGVTDVESYDGYAVRCPHGEPQGLLWVREAWRTTGICYEPYSYRAGYMGMAKGGWKHPLAMPRRASRIILAKTGIRVERLRDIPEHEAHAEGFLSKKEFMKYFDKINGKRKYPPNPWVWVICFELLGTQEWLP